MLPEGDYILHEKEAPSGYTKADDQTFTINVEEYYHMPQTSDNNDTLPLTGLATASLALAGFSLVKRRDRRYRH